MPATIQIPTDKPPSWLRITTDSRHIEQARETARKAKEVRFERIFEALSESFFIDSKTMALIQTQRDKSIARLKSFLTDAQVTDKGVGAALLLCRLHEPAGQTYIGRVLQSGDTEQRKRALGGIDGGIYNEQEKRAYRDILFADKELVAGLLRQLDESDAELVKAAIQCCGYLGIPGANEHFLRMLKRPEVPDRGRILYWLSQGELTEEVFDLAAQSTFNPSKHDEQWGIAIFEAFARKSSGPLKSRSQDQLRAILRAWPEDGKAGFLGNRLGLLTTLGETAEAHDLTWVRELARTEPGHYAVDPLVAWIRLEPEEGTKTLLEWLDSQDRCRVAADAAGKAFHNTADTTVVEHLSKIAKKCKGRELAAICSALNSIGGKAAHRAIEDFATQIDPSELGHFRQSADAVSLEELVQAVQEGGLLSEAELKAASQHLTPPDQQAKEHSPGLFELFSVSERALAFDVETGMLPCRHDELIEDFAKASRGKFHPEAVHEEWHQKPDEEFDAPYTLQFISANRFYQGEIRNLGDWYDVERVVAMINTALADAAIKERFVGLAAEGQFALFVFADPDRLMPLAKRFNMPLSDDMEEAMKKGIEYEDYVRRQLKE